MTNMLQRRGALGVAFALALGLSLAACAPTGGWPGEGQADGQSGTSTPGAGSAATATPSATPGAGRTSGATAAPEMPGARGPQDCLQGTWLADNEFWLVSIRQFGDEIKHVEGQVLVAFDDDGGYSTDYRGWRITAESEGHTVTISRGGQDIGEYTATDTTLSFRDTSIGSELTLSGPVDMVIAPVAATYADAPYACGATHLSISTTDGELRMTRQ